MMENRDDLHQLFARYRRDCPEVEASATFIPRMWERIEAQRGWMWKLRGYSRGLVTVAATVCMMLAAFEFSSLGDVNPLYTKTYLEALDDDNPPETLTYVDVIHHSEGGGELQ